MLTVVTGAPCSGKTTYVRDHAQPGDIVVDYDALAQALGSGRPHDHPDPVRYVAIQARAAAIREAIVQHRRGHRAWIVDCSPTRARMRDYEQAGAEVVTLVVDTEVLHHRADAERPALWHELIDRWRPAEERGVTALTTGRERSRRW